MADSSITANIGGDASGLIGALDTAKSAVGKFADETQKAFKRSMDGRAIATALFSGLGFSLNKLIEQSAQGIARLITGYSKDEEERLNKLIETTGKAADKAEADLAKARERRAKEEQDRSDSLLKEWQMVQDARIKGMEEEAKLAREEADNRKKELADLAETEKKVRRSKMTDEELVLDLQREQAQIQLQINDFVTAQANGVVLQSREIKELNTQKKALLSIEEQIASVVAKRASQEKKITAETELQAKNAKISSDFMAQMLGVSGSRDLSSASNDALAELLSRDKRAMGGLKPGTAFAWHDQLKIDTLANEINRIQKELDFRTNLSDSVGRLGVGGARSGFSGDPLSYDSLVQKYVTDNRSATEIASNTNDLIRQMLNQQKAGIPVINLNL